MTAVNSLTLQRKKANLRSSSVFPVEWRVCIPCNEFNNTFSTFLVSSQDQFVFWCKMQILSHWSSLMLVGSADYCEIILVSEEFSKLSLFDHIQRNMDYDSLFPSISKQKMSYYSEYQVQFPSKWICYMQYTVNEYFHSTPCTYRTSISDFLICNLSF